MNRLMKSFSVVGIALVAAVGCKGKPETGAAPGTVGSPGSAAAVDPVAAAFGPGAARHGCIGWTPNGKIAACITGRRMSNEKAVYRMSFVGSKRAIPIAAEEGNAGPFFPGTGVTRAVTAFRSFYFLEFPTEAQHVGEPGTVALGNGASLVWTSTKTHEGGDNMPPTNKHSVKITCGEKTVDVLDSESAGVDPTFKIFAVGEHIVLETILTTGREGESGVEHSAMRVELATCKAVRTDATDGA